MLMGPLKGPCTLSRARFVTRPDHGAPIPLPATAASVMSKGQRLLVAGHPQELPRKRGFFPLGKAELCVCRQEGGGVDRKPEALVCNHLGTSSLRAKPSGRSTDRPQMERETPGSSHA